MLEVVGVSKSFGDFCVLSEISFEVQEGEIYGLIGYNGVGKTTLMKIMCGIYRANTGCVRIRNQTVYECAALKQQCFFMTEESTHFHQSTLKQMAKFYRGYYPGWKEETFRKLVELFGIPVNVKISRFSKGMQRQAGLILAFSARVKYLFLDEAFDGLDVTMRQLMKDMIRFYVKKKGALVLISSHNLLELEHLADRIGMLSESRLIFDESLTWMQEHFCTCSFVWPTACTLPDSMPYHAQILERQNGTYTCIFEAPLAKAKEALEQMGAEKITVRPIGLEEFFRKECKGKDVDWETVFL